MRCKVKGFAVGSTNINYFQARIFMMKWIGELTPHAAQLHDHSGPSTIDHETGAVS